jgi:aminopeptidase-like protein
LKAEEYKILYVPEGFAHGLLTLEDETEVIYQMSEFYVPELARGVRWNDPFFEIEWPMEPVLMSVRDQNYPNFVMQAHQSSSNGTGQGRAVAHVKDVSSAINPEEVGRGMCQLISELYPLCRSITGNGLRESLDRLKQFIPLTMHEVPTGTQVFDWTVPKEWNIRDAYVKSADGKRLVDFHESNLHVVAYSTPINRRMELRELKEHLFSLPEHPDWIPYRTSYYRESWGFCLSHRQFTALKEDVYDVCIDSTLEDGSLTYAECYLPGERNEEFLFSSHACHPSLCNDNLSGIAVAVFLARFLSPLALKYSYRFLFAPSTIGSICWLALNETKTSLIKHGLVLACVGDRGMPTYKKSRRGDSEIDRASAHVLKHSGQDYKIMNFSPYGYDERQFCSPGFDLPLGCLMRTPNGQFPEYHTSADNLDFVQPMSLADSFIKCLKIVNIIENNEVYVSQKPKCEPRLGKYGLYNRMGNEPEPRATELAMLWALNFSDGFNSLLDIAERADMSFDVIQQAADALVAAGLLMKSSS